MLERYQDKTSFLQPCSGAAQDTEVLPGSSGTRSTSGRQVSGELGVGNEISSRGQSGTLHVGFARAQGWLADPLGQQQWGVPRAGRGQPQPSACPWGQAGMSACE